MIALSPEPKRVPRTVRAATLLFGAVLLVVSACSDAGLFTPKQEGGVRVQLRPQFSFVQSSSAIADISRIRLTITQLPGGAVVQSVVPVDPSATEWNLDLELEANKRYQILLELISMVGNVETVEYSGTVEVDAKPGTQTPPAAVTVIRGPPENLRITSVVISPRDQDVLEGDVVELSARTPGVENPVVEWATSNPEVAAVVGGRVTARAPGRATITAVAGNHRDNINVTVGALATRIDVTRRTRRSRAWAQTFRSLVSCATCATRKCRDSASRGASPTARSQLKPRPAYSARAGTAPRRLPQARFSAGAR